MTQIQMSLRDLSRLVMLQTQSGKSREEVVKVLVARGWPEVSAVRFVEMTLFEQGGRPAQARAPEDEAHARTARPVSSAGPRSGKALLLAVVVVAILSAVLFASVLSILAR